MCDFTYLLYHSGRQGVCHPYPYLLALQREVVDVTVNETVDGAHVAIAE